jgi:hypothetical protein
VGDTEDKIMDVVWGGISQGRDVRSVATDLMAYLKGGPEIVKGRWGKLEPGTKEYAKRLGSKGVDYRAMRLYRSEIHRNQQEAAVTEGEDNPACTGEYDWILMPGRRVFLCECPKLAEEGPYTKDTIPDYPHPNCLLAGTMILMADGTKKPIEQIAIDDMVITADGNAHKVISIMQTKRHKYFHIFVKGNQIKATDEHPFIKADIKGDETGWIEAKDIHDGDILVIAPDYPRFGINSLRGIKVESVIEVECAIPFIVYNFEVETRHNYIANDFVTHNCDCMVEPRVKDGDDLINELRAYMKGEPEGNDIALWAQEQGLADDGTVGMMVPGGAEGEPGHRGDMAQIQEDIKQLVGMESVNLNGVDKDLAEGIYDGYKTVLDRYPILRGQFNLLGINENRPNHAASTNPVTGEINVNLDTFGLSKYVIGKIYNKKVKDAYFPQGTSWKSIIIHEIGHRIDGYLTKLILGRNWDKGNYTNNISYTLRNNILKNLNISDIKRNLSEYAEFSEPDFLAEAFSEFMSSNDPRPIAKMAGGFIDYYLKE